MEKLPGNSLDFRQVTGLHSRFQPLSGRRSIGRKVVFACSVREAPQQPACFRLEACEVLGTDSQVDEGVFLLTEQPVEKTDRLAVLPRLDALGRHGEASRGGPIARQMQPAKVLPFVQRNLVGSPFVQGWLSLLCLRVLL